MAISDETQIRDLHIGMAVAMDADRKKQEINDAKMRAVAQRVDYDQFCHLVAGAHLKPVKPIDKGAHAGGELNYFVMPAPAKPLEPSAARAAGGPAPAAAAPRTASAALQVPKSGLEFHKAWRRQCKDLATRVAYLRLVDPQLIPTTFQAEFEPDILDGVVRTLDALLDSEALPARVAAALAHGGAEAEALGDDVHMAASWIAMLPEVNKFELALEFRAPETHDALLRIVRALRASGCERLPRGSERLARELRELLSPRALDEVASKFR